MTESATHPQNFVNGIWDGDFRSEAHVAAMSVLQEKFEALVDSLSTLEQLALVDASKSESFKTEESYSEPVFSSTAHAMAQGLVDFYNSRAGAGE